MTKADMKKMETFKKEVLSYYRAHKRQMPWRADTRPYYVVVSEIMLQQTQVDRVRTKFASFIKRFPDWRSLANASVHEVLKEWSGLGYNRRGLYLKRIAEVVMNDQRYAFLQKKDIPYMIYLRSSDGGDQPETDLYERLRSLPGIGPNTAGSILAFAFNQPIVFIETNIRSVFIHSFFNDTGKKIPDADILPLIEKALDRKNPREWYYALMDYGSYLKKLHPNPSRRSKHHMKQSAFKGSNRELRSNILKIVMQKKASADSIARRFAKSWGKEKIEKNLDDLVKEGFIEKTGRMFQVTR